jgi:GntR family transcriptional regulator/MocR family aminotransferase
MEVHVSLVARKDLTGEIYRQLRGAILDGRLPPGGRLPPTRELAHRLNVSRTTVTVAYDRLTGEGFIASRVGAGTFVSDNAAGPPGPARPARGALRPRPLWDAIAVPTVFDKPPRFDFRTGIPDATLFPVVSGGLNWVKGNRERALGPPLAMRAATGGGASGTNGDHRQQPRALHVLEDPTLITTLPIFWPVSTYRYASTIWSNRYRRSMSGLNAPDSISSLKYRTIS